LAETGTPDELMLQETVAVYHRHHRMTAGFFEKAIFNHDQLPQWPSAMQLQKKQQEDQ
jgi:hypothetical protein